MLLCCVFCFFKQKTAYEMRISDWSSDVCSSDLDYAHLPDAGAALAEAIKTGVSRYPTSTGRGQGFVQLCRSMVTDRAELRFRSGDHALMLCPTHDPLNGDQRLSHTSALAGMTICAIWRAEAL